MTDSLRTDANALAPSDNSPGTSVSSRYTVFIGNEAMEFKGFNVESENLSYLTLATLVKDRAITEPLFLRYNDDRSLTRFDLPDKIDLKDMPSPRFIVFDGKDIFGFSLNGVAQNWGSSRILGKTLKILANEDANDYGAWKEGTDAVIEDTDYAQIDRTGTDKFITGPLHLEDGSPESVLQEKDIKFLEDNNLPFTEHRCNGVTGVILENFSLPPNLFQIETANILVVLPSGYPMVPPDMFFLLPWLKLSKNGQFPVATSVGFVFCNNNWQQWSRHNYSWKPGIDGLQTTITRIRASLERENDRL